MNETKNAKTAKPVAQRKDKSKQSAKKSWLPKSASLLLLIGGMLVIAAIAGAVFSLMRADNNPFDDTDFRKINSASRLYAIEVPKAWKAASSTSGEIAYGLSSSKLTLSLKETPLAQATSTSLAQFALETTNALNGNLENAKITGTAQRSVGFYQANVTTIRTPETTYTCVCLKTDKDFLTLLLSCRTTEAEAAAPLFDKIINSMSMNG